MANPAQSSDGDIGLEVPGYKFWIEIDGKRAKQYQVEQENDVVSCYIASEVNKEFTIVTQRSRLETMSVHYYLHDDCIAKRLFKAGQGKLDNKLAHIQTVHGNQKFAFSSINFADDEQMGLTSIPENLGTIRIELYHVKSINGPTNPIIYSLGNASTMSEKSKSIGFHTVSLRPPETIIKPRPTTNITYVDRSKPWITVKFFYRPLDVLRAQGIASGFQLKPNPEDAGDRQDNPDQDPERPSPAPKTESTEERKPLVTFKKKAYRTEKTKVTIETIIIESSDSEVDEPSKVENKGDTSLRRPRKSSVEPVHRKRQKTTLKPDPDIIVLDSD